MAYNLVNTSEEYGEENSQLLEIRNPHSDRDSPDEVGDEIDGLLTRFWSNRKDGAAIWRPAHDHGSQCHRCGKKVYPVEKVDVGVVYHRECFKCRVCGRHLTLKTFQREVDIESSNTKEVYCNAHVPRLTKGHLDRDALGIRVALDAQRNASNNARLHMALEKDWHYDPTGSPGMQFVQNVTPRYSKVKRRSTLKSWSDFERHGVFAEQETLEAIHRQEEDELYRQMFEEREQHVIHLEELLEVEKARTVNELVAWFERKGASDEAKQGGLEKLEEFFLSQREEQVKALMTRLAAEEQAAVARLVEKHSNEMLMLIREKEKQARAESNREKRHKGRNREDDQNKENQDLENKRQQMIEEQRQQLILKEQQLQKQQDELRKQQEQLQKEHLQQQQLLEKHKEQLKQEEVLRQRAEQIRRQQLELERKQAEQQRQWELEQERRRRRLLELQRQQEAEAQQQAEEDRYDEDAAALDEYSEEDEEEEEEEFLENYGTHPKRAPPTRGKSAFYTDPEIFKDQDTLAIEESKRDHTTFTDLIRRLSRRCETELQKIRSIFRWITVKDLDNMTFSETLDPNSPLGILRGIKYGTESYHDLFKRLCSYIGIHCEIIEGYSKGAGYRPGSSFTGELFRNQWTAVWVENGWRFINCKWGARHVRGPRDAKMTYKCDEFYFLTDPKEHIYQHFSDDPIWQLLDEQITLEEFTKLPVVKSPFFNNKLSFARPYDAILEASDGMREVRIHASKLMPFAAKVSSRDKDVPQEILKHRALIRFIENDVAIHVNLPSPGFYLLDIYMAGSWSTENMDNACSFLVHCTGISRDANISYPPVGIFGRSPYFLKYGFSEQSHYDPYIISTGQLNLAFSLRSNIRISCKLRRWDVRDRVLSDYDKHAMMDYKSDNHATFVIQCPRRGSYVFSVYAADADNQKDEMKCVYRYYIECQAPMLDAHVMPKTSRRWKHCRLVDPLNGELAVKSEVRFKLESKRAVDITVVINDHWTSLENKGKVWQGSAFTGSTPGKAMLYARFDTNSEKYIPLLEYVITERQKFNYV